MLIHTRNPNNSGIRFHKQTYNEYHCTKAAKMFDIQNSRQNHLKNPKSANFFYSQPSTLSVDVHAKFYFSKTFGLSCVTRFVAPT